MSFGGTPAKTPFSRVFLIAGQAGPTHEPDYQDCAKAMGLSQSFGDVSKIEIPSSVRRGDFEEIGEIQEAKARGTTSVVGRYLADLQSEMLRLARKRCPVDLLIVFGSCSDPRVWSEYTKIVPVVDARITDWETDELGAVESGEGAAINETINLSYEDQYEILPLDFSQKGGDVVTNPIVDVIIADRPECGDCDNESDGCQDIYAVTLSSPGSPGTAPDVVYSVDKGLTWAADDVNSLLSGEDANALAAIGLYVVVVSEDSESIHYKLKTLIDNGTAGYWVENATGIVATRGPLDIWSVGTYAFISAEGGYIYGTNDPTVGVTVLDAGVATTNDLNAIHAISEKFSVTVGDSDTIVWTKDGETWSLATATGGGGDLLCVWIKNKKQWWVGDSNGDVYYTLDGGLTWTEKVLPGTGWTQINDISFIGPDNVVGYISAEKGADGFMLRTVDGGYSWIVLPESYQDIPAADSYDAHAACQWDHNFVVAGGLADDAADGILIVGKD